jgi:UrcA family protein
MRLHNLRLSNHLLLAGAGLFLALTPVRADEDTTSQSESVTVTAPYIVQKTEVQKPMGKRPALTVVSISRPVSYVDLDLSKAADAQKLRDRVKTAAADVCTELDKRFPKSQYMPEPASQDCVGAATSESLLVVNRLIAASTTK